MRELEKKAEELQNRGEEDDGERGDEGNGENERPEETEEEKRMRVRRELEKVKFPLTPDLKIHAPLYSRTMLLFCLCLLLPNLILFA